MEVSNKEEWVDAAEVGHTFPASSARCLALHQSRVVSNKQTNKTSCPSRLYIPLRHTQGGAFFSSKPPPPPTIYHHPTTTTTTTTIHHPNHLVLFSAALATNILIFTSPRQRTEDGGQRTEVDVTVLSLRVNNPLHAPDRFPRGASKLHTSLSSRETATARICCRRSNVTSALHGSQPANPPTASSIPLSSKQEP